MEWNADWETGFYYQFSQSALQCLPSKQAQDGIKPRAQLGIKPRVQHGMKLPQVLQLFHDEPAYYSSLSILLPHLVWYQPLSHQSVCLSQDCCIVSMSDSDRQECLENPKQRLLAADNFFPLSRHFF